MILQFHTVQVVDVVSELTYLLCLCSEGRGEVGSKERWLNESSTKYVYHVTEKSSDCYYQPHFWNSLSSNIKMVENGQAGAIYHSWASALRLMHRHSGIRYYSLAPEHSSSGVVPARPFLFIPVPHCWGIKRSTPCTIILLPVERAQSKEV